MKPLNLSSGDLAADRRADYAEMLFASGDFATAFEPMRGALELAPGWAMGWYRLGEMLEAAGRLDDAAGAWATALKLEPDDRPGAALKLELIGRLPASAAPPGAYVEALFDSYASTFDASLLLKLVYRVPELLFDAIVARDRGRFATTLDLGCGTGLMGEKLRTLTDRLEGYDISSAMLRKAGSKALYDRLEKADLNTLALPPRGADLMVAADVFLYLGALDRIVSASAKALTPGGLLAFSVERHEGAQDFALLPSRRYAHSERYVARTLDEAGLVGASIEAAVIRMDRGEPIEGLIVVVEKPA